MKIYEDYAQMLPHWPSLPPAGLMVAVHPESVGLGRDYGRRAMVVSLEPRDGFQNLAPVTALPLTFLADPGLELDEPDVRSDVRAAGVDDQAYRVAASLQADFLTRWFQKGPLSGAGTATLSAPAHAKAVFPAANPYVAHPHHDVPPGQPRGIT